MKMQGFEPRFSQNLAPVRAKQNPKTLTSSIFHIYSANSRELGERRRRFLENNKGFSGHSSF